MRKSLIPYLILIAFSLFYFTGISYALPANNGITITGTTSGSITHAPIQDVTISTNVSGVSFKALTDNLGKYSLNITFTKKPALIILVASKNGYLPSVRLLYSIQPGRSYVASFSLIDITPPSKPIVTDDGQYTNSITTLHAKWYSEDAQSGIKQYYYSIGTSARAENILRRTSAGKNTEITLTRLNLVPNKTYYFNVRAVNGVGLVSKIGSSDGITVDTTAPSGVVIINDNTQYAESKTVTLTLSATDTGSGLSKMRFSNDGTNWSTPGNYDTSKEWTLTTGDGTKTVYARFIDVVGNISTPVTDTIVLDTTAPLTAITSPQNEFISAAQTITVSGTIDDNQATVTVNGIAATVSSGTFTANNITLDLNSNTITATATDLAGNTSSNSITVIYQEATPPSIIDISPIDGSTFTEGDTVDIQVTATDDNNYPLEYEFLVNGEIKQDWGSSSAYTWIASPIPTLVTKITCKVRNNQGKEVSQDVNYNVQIITSDTTPPTAPTLTTDSTSSSLNSITAQWSSEDPESGIMEYQYAIGTTPGGTDVVYWTTYGNNTQAFLSGLNLTKGQAYYLSVVAKNGAGLKSSVSTSPAITGMEEAYVKINYPYQNALIEDREVKVKGIAEGISQITVNGKPVAVNPDGSFEGLTLVAPGYAARQGITSSDPNYIIMNFPGETTITASGGGEEDTVLFYYTQLPLKNKGEQNTIYYNYTPGMTDYSSYIWEFWNYNSLLITPFENWDDESSNARFREFWNYNSLLITPFENWDDESSNARFRYPSTFSADDYAQYGQYDPMPLWYSVHKMNTRFYNYGEDGTPILGVEENTTGETDCFIHTPPAVKGEVKPLVLILFDCWFLETNHSQKNPPPFHLESYKVNGQPLKKLYGDFTLSTSKNACYAILTDYEPDSDLQLKIEAPFYPERIQQPEDRTTAWQQYFFCRDIDTLTLETVREVPYGSGNYVLVNTIPIFQPDDGKGRGPSAELVNMPFLKLKFNEEPSDLQINTLQAYLTIADETKTYNLIEAAPDSGIFTNSDNSFTLSLRGEAEAIPNFNSNAQDELTCSVTSSFGNLNNKLFNLKESASDSLYFNDIKTFVTITFNNELLPYQNDTLTIQYDNGMLASEETLTETSTDSLVFTNESNSLTLKLNNYQGSLPDILDVTIPNQNRLELSCPTFILLRTKSNQFAYSNYSGGKSSDLPPNDPDETGQGIFRLRVKGLSKGLTSDILDDLDITVGGGIQEEALPILEQFDGSYMTGNLILLPEGLQAAYPGIVCLNSIDSQDEWQAKMMEGSIISEKKLKRKSALIAASAYPEPLQDETTKDILNTIYNRFGGIHGDRNLGYVTSICYDLTKEELDKELPLRSVLYIYGEGVVDGDNNDTFVGFALWKDDNHDSAITLKPEDVNGKDYKLVFLDGCLTADERTSLPNEFKASFDTKVYMGWKTETDTILYAQQFFLKLDEKNWKEEPNTVSNAYSQLYGTYFGKTKTGVRLYGSNVKCIISEDISIDLLP